MVRVIDPQEGTQSKRLEDVESDDIIIGESFPGELFQAKFGGGGFPLRTTPSGEPAPPTPTEPTVEAAPVDTTVRPSPISPALVKARQQQARRERQIAIGTAARVLERGTTETETSFRERRRQLGASIIAGQPREAQRFFTEREAEVEARKDIQKQIEKAQALGKEVRVVPGGVQIKEILEPKSEDVQFAEKFLGENIAKRIEKVEAQREADLEAGRKTVLPFQKPFRIAARGLLIPARKLSKIAEPILPEVLTKPRFTKREAEEIVGTQLQTSFFALPLATTTQIQKQILLARQIPKVRIIGKEQEIGRKTIKTKVLFETSEREAGRALGITRIIKTGKEGTRLTRTIAAGKITDPTPRAILGTGKFAPKDTRIFITGRKAISKPAKVIFEKTFRDAGRLTRVFRGGVQTDIGVVLKTTGRRFGRVAAERTVSASGSIAKKDLSFIFGRTVTERGGKVISESIIRTLPKVSRETVRTLTKSGRLALGKTALTSVTASVEAAVVKTPRIIGPVVRPVIVPKRVKLVSVGIPVSIPKVKLVSAVRLSPAFVPAVRERARVRTRAVAKIRLKEIQKPRQREIIIPKIIEKGLQKQRALTIPKLTLRLRGRAAPRGFTVPRIVVPKIPIIPPPVAVLPDIRTEREAGRRGRRRLQREDLVLSEGFIARVTGLKPIKIPKKDIEKLAEFPRALGIRRIPDIK